MTTASLPPRTLQVIDRRAEHCFKVPAKCIHDGDDVSFFLASKAYTDILTFIFQLTAAIIPRRIKDNQIGKSNIREWNLQDDDILVPPIVEKLGRLMETLKGIINDAPPDTGPRRFGNVSFRKWYDIVKERISGGLLNDYLPVEILALGSSVEVPAKAELEAYLIGSFGSSQRLDYGTGHELSFLAFLGCLWKLGAFPESEGGDVERALILKVIEPYFELIRRLILTYTLEPAGSHGVWGLDDHSFLPYILGSAQLSPAISSPADIAMEGSVPGAPDPGDVAKANIVERERPRNMYFSAIGFINDVKKGPFWEHSPILFDISGVKAGWAKINKGMLKMYDKEVLSKFPVVQHFPFGSLFVWEKDPAAAEIAKTVHTASQPKSAVPAARSQPPLRDPMGDLGAQTTRAPWAGGSAMPPAGGTAAPWASSRVPTRPGVSVPSGPNQPTRAPWASSAPLPAGPGSTTTAPWAKSGASAAPGETQGIPSTRAPWADRKPQG